VSIISLSCGEFSTERQETEAMARI